MRRDSTVATRANDKRLREFLSSLSRWRRGLLGRGLPGQCRLLQIHEVV